MARINWKDNPRLVGYLDGIYVALEYDADAATGVALTTLEAEFPELEGRLTESIVHWQFDARRMQRQHEIDDAADAEREMI